MKVDCDTIEKKFFIHSSQISTIQVDRVRKYDYFMAQKATKNDDDDGDKKNY